MNPDNNGQDSFTIEQRGGVVLITPASHLESMDPTIVEDVSHLLLDPIRHLDPPLVVIDLQSVDFFGSSFLVLLLRCWRQVRSSDGQMVLTGVSDHAKELLRMTSMDMLWPIYTNRLEAIEALLAD